MKAVALESIGSSPKLLDLPTPHAEPGEVLVRIRASSVNGFDLAVVAGWVLNMMEHRFPMVLGRDFAGTVEAVGPGTSRFSVGDSVFGAVLKPVLVDGGFGEYVSVPEALAIARIPSGLDMATAGALALAGTTALMSVEAVAPAAGDTVLISGATGGVGSIAVQLAAARGARVIATARSEAGSAFVRSLGAAHTVDYTGDLAAQVRAISPGGVAAVIHLAGDAPQLADLLVPNGRFASPLLFGPNPLGDRRVAVTSIQAFPTPEVLGRLADDVVAGRLRVHIQSSYRLDEVPRAFADFAAPHLGKLAIAVG